MDINTVSPVNGSSGAVDSAVSSPPPAKTVAVDPVQEEQKAGQKLRDQESSLSVDDIKELAEGMNEIMDDLQTSIGFSIREELNHQVVVEIKDRQTDELIKQIPSEELLAIKEKMEEFTGLLFDQQA
jgi:flagellar protein FlaG